MAAAKESVKAVQKLLDRLRVSEQQRRRGRISGDEMERIAVDVAEQARHLPPEGILESLDLALARRKATAADQLTILRHALDQPKVIRRVGEWLASPDADLQAAALLAVAEKCLTQFAPNLNPLIESRGPLLKPAILAAGKLQSPVNITALLNLAARQDSDLDLPLVHALRNYPEAGQPFLTRIFETIYPDEARPAPRGARPLGSVQSAAMAEFIAWNGARIASDLRKRIRVLAAGGLAKLGNRAAIAFLLEMLYDPDEAGPAYCVHGQSRNAAEALCHAFLWPLEPRANLVDRIRALAAERFGPQGYTSG